MCIICIELEKNNITSKDAQSALLEMANEINEEHFEEVLQKIETLGAKDDFKRLLKMNQTTESCPKCGYDPCDCLWGPHE